MTRPSLTRATRPLRLAALALAAASTLALTACGDDAVDQPTPSTTSSASRTPSSGPSQSTTPSVSITDDSTIDVIDPVDRQGVIDAIARYWTQWNQIARLGGDPLTIYDVSHEPLSDIAYGTLREWQESGTRQTGDVLVDVIEVFPPEADILYADVCVDTTAADIVDAAGQSKWDPSEPRRTASVFAVSRRGGVYLPTVETSSLDPC
ncbi:MAG: hypothetical protein LBL55_05085 [Propionibacteriaceae bacterium]|jgi:hypothetical protein|nr:hypothetical protein [Propionibacteriaceae bacterium]